MAGAQKTSQFDPASSVAATDEVPLLQDGQLKRVPVQTLVGVPDIDWTGAGETWQYLSWNGSSKVGVMTVPTDATTKYAVGMAIRFTQSSGGTKYGAIMALTATTITFRLYNSATFANEALSDTKYTTLATPYGIGRVTPERRQGGLKVGIIPAATFGSTGNKAITGLGFKPKLVRFTFMIDITFQGRSCNGAMDDTGSQFAVAQTSNSSSNTSQQATNRCAMWYQSDGTTRAVDVSYVSMDEDGFTINVHASNSAYALAYEAYA